MQINGSSILNNGVANIPYASSSTPGLVKNGLGIALETGTGKLYLDNASEAQIKGGSQSGMAITPVRQHISTFYALAKLAGADMAQSSNAVGTYTDAAKQGIQKLFGFEDILGNYESSTTASKAYTVGETFIFNGKRYRVTADIAQNYVIIPGTNCELDPIDGHYVRNTDYATSSKAGVVKIYGTSYGLEMSETGILKIVSASSGYIKEGTDARRPIMPYKQHESVFFGLSKAAGVDLANETVTVGTYPTSSKTAILTMLGAVANDKKAGNSSSDLGLVFAAAQYGVSVSEYGGLYLSKASSELIKAGTNEYKSIVPANQHESAFYALAKAAGDTTQEQSNNAIGTYTTEAKAAILAMLGANGEGLTIINGQLRTNSASTSTIKTGANSYAPIVSSHIHDAAFFGLAKAAGDTTQASSSNAVGTYTEAAKTAIRGMLGIDGSAAIVEEVTGTVPTITGMPNVRYICGEVSLLTITPPACGSIEVIFTSGSTASTLTVPNSVKWPAWFEAEELDSNMIYDIIITDAAYGAVMAWAN